MRGFVLELRKRRNRCYDFQLSLALLLSQSAIPCHEFMFRSSSDAVPYRAIQEGDAYEKAAGHYCVRLLLGGRLNQNLTVNENKLFSHR